MNDFIKIFFVDNAPQVWTIISVIVGGFTTYVSTTYAESRKIKRQFQQKKLEEVLIPYCTCLEATQKFALLPHIKKTQCREFFENYFTTLQKPEEFLKAARRVYLPPRQRKDLELYAKLLSQLEESLDKEASDYIKSYTNYIKVTLKKFPGQDSADSISINFSPGTRYLVEYAILSQKTILLQNEIKNICFYWDVGTNHPLCDEFSLNSSVREFIKQIDFDVFDIADYLHDSDDEAIQMYQNSYDMLCYLGDALSDEVAFSNQSLKTFESPKIYFQIVDLLNSMTNDLTKVIDDIAF